MFSLSIAGALLLSIKRLRRLSIVINSFSKIGVSQSIYGGIKSVLSIHMSLNKIFDSEGVKMYHTYSEKKATIVERMIRTLKEKCERIKTQCEQENKNYNLVEVLPKVLEEYNLRTVHSTIGMTPQEASMKKNELKLQEMYNEKYLKYDPPEGKSGSHSQFKINDRVRISVYKSLFTKGYKNNWSTEIFVVSKIHDTRPVTYSIKDLSGDEITGKFYSQELLKSES
jgi:hypothetical protein